MSDEDELRIFYDDIGNLVAIEPLPESEVAYVDEVLEASPSMWSQVEPLPPPVTLRDLYPRFQGMGRINMRKPKVDHGWLKVEFPPEHKARMMRVLPWDVWNDDGSLGWRVSELETLDSLLDRVDMEAYHHYGPIYQRPRTEVIRVQEIYRAKGPSSDVGEVASKLLAIFEDLGFPTYQPPLLELASQLGLLLMGPPGTTRSRIVSLPLTVEDITGPIGHSNVELDDGNFQAFFNRWLLVSGLEEVATPYMPAEKFDAVCDVTIPDCPALPVPRRSEVWVTESSPG